MPRRRHREQPLPEISGRERIDALESAADERPRRRRGSGAKGRWGRRFLFAGIAGLGILAILPNLIGWSGMHQSLVDWGARDFEGRIRVARFSAGWFQSVKLDAVEAVDAEGMPLAGIGRIETSNTLIGLLTSRSPGKITLDRPVVHLQLREGGSNLEDAVARYTQPDPDHPADPAAPLPRLQLVIRDGTLNLSSGAHGLRTLGGLQAEVQIGGEAALTASASLENGGTGNPAAGGQPGGGRLEVVASLDQGSPFVAGENGELHLTADRFDLSAVAPLLERVFGRSASEGVVTGRVVARFAEGGRSADAEFRQLAVAGWKFGAARLIGPDLFSLAALTASGSTAVDGRGITAKGLDLQCDLGSVRGEGELAWSQLAQLSGGQIAAAPFQLDGRLDLARLAALLPGTLALHRDLRLESGELKFNVASRMEGNLPRVVANLDTVNLAARRGDRQILWQQPLRIAAAVSQANGQMQIEDFLCQSDFLQVRGSGNLASARFETSGDLEKLLERLQQFASLDDWRLAGQMTGEFTCRCEGAATASPSGLAGRPIDVVGRISLQNARIQLPGIPPLEEPRIRLALNATAQAGSDGSLAVLGGSGELDFGADLATFRLTAPVRSLFAVQEVEAEAGLKGSLARWLGLVRSFASIGSFQATGQGTASALLKAGSRQISASGLKYEFSQFALDGYGMKIREDQVSGTAEMIYEIPTATLSTSQLTLVSSSIAAAGQNLKLVAGKTLDLSGQVGLRGDLHRLAGWFGMSDPEDSVQYFGNLEGNVQLSSNGEFLQGAVQAVVRDFVAAKPDYEARQWVELLREPQLQLGGTVALAQTFNDLKLNGVQLAGRSVTARVDGTIRDVAGSFGMELAGEWTPDWQQIDGLVQAWSGEMVHLSGRDSQKFTVRGPLFETPAAGQAAAAVLPASTQVATELKWTNGSVFLLPLGPARIQAGLTGSVVRVETGEIDFGGGKVSLQPELDLALSPPLVRVPPGTVASRIQLTPEFCRDWMKYVAPLLADVTTAEGSFSVRTEGLVMPLDNPMAVQSRGVVTLHSVTVGAGPLGQRLLETVQSVRSMLKGDLAAAKDRSVWMNLGEQEIPFALQDGRVFHEGLRLQVKDLQVVTRGSVGFDQSLSMVAVIPIHDDWLNGERWLEGLRGQKLEIPVSGTVSKPVLDNRAIQQLATQLGQRVAQQELNRVVGEQTQKLQARATEELNQFQQKIQGKLQSGVRDNLQGELKKGLDGLFGPVRTGGTEPPPAPPAGSGGGGGRP